MKRTLSLVLALTLLASLAPATARAGDADGLLAKHKAYVGFTFGDGSLPSYVETEKSVKDKDDSAFYDITTRRLGVLFRTDSVGSKGKLNRYNGFTGNIFWASDENGITVPSIGNPSKLALSEDLLFTDAIATVPWALHGNGQTPTGPAAIVRVTVPSALPVDLYIDPDTGAYKRAVIDPGGDQERTFDIFGYIDAAPGKKILGNWRIVGSSYKFGVVKVVAGPVATADLHPPTQTALWTFANANPFPIKITDKRVIVKAKINGTEGTFLFDTGAGGVVLSDDFAKKAKVAKLGKIQSSSIGGSTESDTLSIDTLEIGGNVLSNVHAFTLHGHVDKDAPDGLLGFPLLGAAFVTLDITGGTLTIQDPASFDPAMVQGVHVGADLSTEQPVVPFKVNGSATLNAILDTGAPGQVLLANDYIFRHNIRMLFSGYMIVGGATGFAEADDCGSLQSMALGPIDYQSPEACESYSFDGSEGLVGFSFLQSFGKIAFDYPHSGLIFVPKT